LTPSEAELQNKCHYSGSGSVARRFAPGDPTTRAAPTAQAGEACLAPTHLSGRLFAIVLLLSSPAIAAEIDEVHVNSTALQETEAESPTAFVTVIEPETGKGRVEDLAEVLKEAAGIEVQSYGGLGSFSTIMIRGASSAQVGVFVDGVPVMGSNMGTVDLSTIPVSNIEKIEIYRSFTPAFLAPSNMGGAVNIVTKKKPGLSAEAGTYYGSFVTRDANAFISWNKDKLSLTGFAEYFGTNGDFRYLNDNGTPFNPNDDFWDTRKNNVSNSFSGNVDGSYEIKEKLKLFFRETPFWRNEGVPGTGSVQALHSSYEIFRNMVEAGVETGPWGDTGKFFRFSVSDLLTLDKFSDPDGETGIGVPRIITGNDNSVLTRALFRFAPSEKHIMTAAAGVGYEAFSSTNEIPVRFNGGTSQRVSWYLVADDTITPVGNILTITPSIRVEGVCDIYDYRPFDPAYSNPLNGTRTDTELLPSIGIKVQPLNWLAIKGNVGLVARQPYFYEMFGESGSVTGNPELQPERGNEWDVGLVLSPPTLHFEYAYFQSYMTDLIQFMQNSQKTTIAENIGKAFITGHEFHLSWNPFKGANLSGSYTYQNALSLSPIPYQHGKQLPYRPKNTLFVRAEYEWEWLKVWYEFNFISDNYFDTANLLPTPSGVPPRYIHNAGVAFLIPRVNIRLALEGKNLSNCRVEDFAGYPLPGISFFGSVTWKL